MVPIFIFFDFDFDSDFFTFNWSFNSLYDFDPVIITIIMFRVFCHCNFLYFKIWICDFIFVVNLVMYYVNMTKYLNDIVIVPVSIGGENWCVL